MYEFFFSLDLPLNTCAVRRMPCCCKEPGSCNEQKNRGWDFTKSAQDQEKFQRPPNCQLTPTMKDMNNWLFISTHLQQSTNDEAKAQCNQVLQDSLKLHVREILTKIKPLQFGAISCNKKRELFLLVQWQGVPFQLTEEAFVEGGTVAMPVGTWVCAATWYCRIHHAPGWFERTSSADTNLYSLQLVATPNVTVETYNPQSGRQPPPMAKREYNQRTARGAVKYIPKNQLTIINRDIYRLEKLEPIPMNDEDADTDDDSDDDNLQSDDDLPKECGNEDEDEDKDED